jgi:hypothetical protein
MKSKKAASKPKKMDDVERFLAMTDAERDADVARYDRPMPIGADGLPGEPLTPAMREQWENSKIRRRGRQKVGRGAQRILVTVERGLLEEADAYAKANGLKRAELIAEGLRVVMGHGV